MSVLTFLRDDQRVDDFLFGIIVGMILGAGVALVVFRFGGV